MGGNDRKIFSKLSNVQHIKIYAPLLSKELESCQNSSLNSCNTEKSMM
jgi:hypothetical protein